jgi:membrane dipeptidase
MLVNPLLAMIFAHSSASAQSPSLQGGGATIQVDLHLDTPSQMLDKGLTIDAAAGLQAGLPQLKAGGTNAPVLVLWPPRAADHLAHTRKLLAKIEADVARLEELELVRSPSELRRAVAMGHLGALVSLEGAHGLGSGDWRAVLHELHGRGLAMLGLTWSFSNRFAGSSGDGGGGLTEEGRQLVAEARRLGIVLDVSHASRATTLETCLGSPVPVIASHSNAHAVQAHPRNLSDEELLCVAATGGVVGLNFHAPFVSSGASTARVADHADHIGRVAGRHAVALGSDYDGHIRTPAGLPDASALPALWDELRRRGWSEAELRGLRGENFLRAWQGALDGAR